MRRGTLEIETVADLHVVMLVGVEPDFEFAAQHVQKFFAFVRIGFSAASAALDAKQVGLHRGVAPRKKLHAHAFGGLKNFALGGPYQAGIILGRLKKRKNIGAIVARNPSQRADGGAHLAAFERAEKTDGYTGGAGYLCERKIAALAEAAESRSGISGALAGDGNDSLAFQNVNDSGRIQPARAAKK